MKRHLNPGALLAPVPSVMVSCRGTHPSDKPNIITLAWVGVACSHPPMVSISVRPERFSYSLIKASGEFAINLVGVSLCEAMDFCGVRSGRDVDKFAHLNLAPQPLETLSYAVGIGESPLILGCKVKQILPLGTHDLFLAEVVETLAEESLFDKDDRLALEQAELVRYDHGDYYAPGRHLGFFGYSVAGPQVRKRRMQQAKGRRPQGGPR